MELFSFFGKKEKPLKSNPPTNKTRQTDSSITSLGIYNIYQACQQGDVKKTKQFIAEGAAFDYDNAGLFPLHYLMIAKTSVENKQAILDLLHTLPDFNINQRSVYESVAAIELAATIEDQEQGISDILLLLSNGADPYIFDPEKNNILHLAVYEQRFGTAYYLISKVTELCTLKNVHDESPIDLIHKIKAENNPDTQQALSILIDRLNQLDIPREEAAE